MPRAWAARTEGPVPDSFGPLPPGGSLGELIARLLWQRGIRDAAAAATFLDPTLARGLRPPSVFPGLEDAAARIADRGASVRPAPAVASIAAATMLNGWIGATGPVDVVLEVDGVRVDDVPLAGSALQLGVTGATFYLLIALRRVLRARGCTDLPDLRACLDLAALGALADGSALRDEQRVLVALGIRRMEQGARPGLTALAELAHVERLSGRAIAARLVPRLEASITAGGPGRVCALLEAATPHQARAIAAAIEIEAAQVAGQRHAQPTASTELLLVDGDWSLAAVNARLMFALARLEPFGPGNPEPVLVARGARLDGARLAGDPARPWWRLRLRQDSRTVRGFAQHLPASALVVGAVYDVAYTPRPGHVRGGGVIEIAVHDVRVHEPLAT